MGVTSSMPNLERVDSPKDHLSCTFHSESAAKCLFGSGSAYERKQVFRQLESETDESKLLELNLPQKEFLLSSMSGGDEARIIYCQSCVLKKKAEPFSGWLEWKKIGHSWIRVFLYQREAQLHFSVLGDRTPGPKGNTSFGLWCGEDTFTKKARLLLIDSNSLEELAFPTPDPLDTSTDFTAHPPSRPVSERRTSREESRESSPLSGTPQPETLSQDINLPSLMSNMLGSRMTATAPMTPQTPSTNTARISDLNGDSRTSFTAKTSSITCHSRQSNHPATAAPISRTHNPAIPGLLSEAMDKLRRDEDTVAKLKAKTKQMQLEVSAAIEAKQMRIEEELVKETAKQERLQAFKEALANGSLEIENLHGFLEEFSDY